MEKLDREIMPAEHIDAQDNRDNGFSRRDILKMAAGLAGVISAGGAGEAAKIFERIAGKGGPKISVEVFLAAHETAKDAEGLPEKIRKADVYVPEFFGVDVEGKGELDNISRGAFTPDEFIKKHSLSNDGFMRQELGAIYGTHVRIEIFDIPFAHPRSGAISVPLDEALNVHFGFKFEDAIRDKALKLKQFAETEIEREEYILRAYAGFVRQLRLKKIPGLEDKEEVKILLCMGALHTRIYHGVKKEGDSASRTTSRMPYIFPHSLEAARRYSFNRGVSEELLAKCLMNSLLADFVDYRLKKITEDTSLLFQLVRKITDLYSADEIRAYYETARTMTSEERDALADASFEAKGVRFPQDEKGLWEIAMGTRKLTVAPKPGRSVRISL